MARLVALAILLAIFALASANEIRNRNKRNGRPEHNDWRGGREGDQRHDNGDGRNYRYHNGQWEYVSDNRPNNWFDKNRQRWENQWGSRSSWRSGDYCEERYDRNDGHWYRYDGRQWILANGDHFNWDEGREGEQRLDEQNNFWYSFHDGRWVYVRSNTVTTFNRNQWGSRRNWNGGRSDEERYDTDSGSWLQFHRGSWVRATGRHVTWSPGAEGEYRRDDGDSNHWYVCRGGRWQRDFNRS